MKHISRNKKSFLWQALLASTLVTVISAPAYGVLLDLGAGAANKNSDDAGFFPTDGYNYKLAGITFNITDGDNIGVSAGISVDNNNGVPATPFAGAVLNFQGSSQVAGTVGPTNPMLTFNLDGESSTVRFAADVTLSGGINMNKDGTVAFADGVDLVSGYIDNTTGTAGKGKIVFEGSNVTHSSIGNTNAFQLITANSNGGGGEIIIFEGPVVKATTIHLNDNAAVGSTLQFNNVIGQVTANITTKTNGLNTLDLLAVDTLTGNIGAGGTGFGTVKVGATDNTTVIGNIVATTTQFQADNTLSLGDGNTITGNVDSKVAGSGSLEFLGAGSVSGTIGATNALNQVVLTGAGKAVTLNGDTKVTNSINFSGTANATSALNLADGVDITGEIDNKTAATAGVVNFLGNGSVSDAMGGTRALTAINIQGNSKTVSLFDNIEADSLNLTGANNTLNLNAAVTVANTRFSAENTINYVAPTSGPVTGAIDNISGVAGTGTLNFNNDITVTGLVGATKSLKAINILQAGTDATFNSNVSASAINLNALNTSAIFSDNVIVTGAIDNTSGVPFTGTANFLGSGQVTGNIGATNNLFSLKINSAGGATETVELNGAIVKAAVINVNDDGATPTTLTLNNAAMALTGNITTTANDLSILNVLNAATITGQIGAAGNEFNLMKVAQNGNTKVDGDIFANTVQFNGNNTLTLTDGSGITGNVTTTANNQGILALLGTSNITGTIGSAGLALNAINLLGTNKVLTIGNDTFANNINIADNGEVIIVDDADFTGNINNTSGVDNKGKLTFEGTGSVSGNIGAANTLNLITVNSLAGAGAETVTLSGNIVRATNITVNDNGADITTLKLDNAAMVLSTGIISTKSDNLNILDINNAAIVNAQIGTGPALDAFNLIKVGKLGNTIINGDIFAYTTQFQADNILTLTDGSEIDGSVDSIAFSQGKLVFAGDSKVTGTIGATQQLNTVTLIGANKTVDFFGDIKASSVNFGVLANNATTINLADDVDITGKVDNTTGSNNVGILNFAGNGSVSSTIGATNSLFQVNLQGANKTVTFSDDVKVGTGNINFALASNATSVLVIGDGANITGNIDNTTGANGKGTLTFIGDSNMNGTIGATNSLANVFLNNVGKTVNFANNVNADAFVFQANGSATLASGITVSSPITTTAAGQGNLTFLGNFTVNNQIGAPGGFELNKITVNGTAGQTVSLFNKMYATDIDINNGGTLAALGPNIVLGGDVNLINGTLAVAAAAQPVSITGNLEVDPFTTLQFDLNTLTPVTPYLDVTLNTNIPTTANLKLTNTPQAYAAGNYDITLVNSGAGGINVPNNVLSDSLLLNFDVTAQGGTKLLLHIDVLPSSLFANRINTVGVAGALDAMAGKDFLGSLQNLLDQLPYFSTQQQLNDGLAALAPIVDGSYMQEAFSAQLLGYGAVSDRIRYLRQRKLIPTVNNHFDTGIASGDDWDDNGHGRWFKLYGQYSDQDVREQVAGYNAETWGLAIGSDVSLNDLNLVGASLNFSHTYVNHDVSDSKSSIYSLQGAIYGEQDFCDWFYFNWVTSVAYNKYTTERNFNFGLLPLSPKADFNGWQFGAKGELGYEYLYRGFHVVPNTSLYYSYLGLTGYNESGAGTANQMVDAQHYSMLKGGIGVRTAYTCPYDMGDRRSLIFQPEVRMNFFYDFINDNMQTTSNFTGGGPSFVTNGFTPAPGSFNVGASLSMFSDFSNYVVTMSYDFETKADYTANAGFLRLRYEW